MIVLLDTHVFLWWILDSAKLSAFARATISNPDHQIVWSAASSWEIAIKYALQRLPLPMPPAVFLPDQLSRNRIGTLPIRNEHAWKLADLPLHHRDPFDRMLVAQALVEKVPLLSADVQLRAYPVEVLW